MQSIKIIVLGNFSPWAKNLLQWLHQEEMAELYHEPEVPRFCQTRQPNAPPDVVLLENLPESRNWIQMVRKSGKPNLMIWIGRNFSKEDLAFAVANRVYAVLEDPKPKDKSIFQVFDALAHTLENWKDQSHVLRTLKMLSVQPSADETEASPTLLSEVKTAVSRLDHLGNQNEFLMPQEVAAHQPTESVPINKLQDLGDALMTVRDLERTGTLWIRGKLPGEEGRIEFMQGTLVSATAGETTAMKALYRMFLWGGARFLFTRTDPQKLTVQSDFHVDIHRASDIGNEMRLRFEGIRQLLPPPDIHLKLEHSVLHEGLTLDPVDFSTLASIVEYSRVQDVIDFNPLPDIELYESLIRLRKASMLRVA